MSYVFACPPPPPLPSNATLEMRMLHSWLMHFYAINREMAGKLMNLGCGLEMDTTDRLAVKKNIESIVCGSGGIASVAHVGMVKGSKRHQSGMMVAAGVID